MSKTISLFYFAILREQAQRSEEVLETEAEDAAELYQELAAKYGFTLEVTQVKVAWENTYHSLDLRLKHGMKLAFIPPVAGG
ncbi:MAG: MoaD/ThiS family protein [Puniceicoccaceae bacterium]